jgi:hypothetical protein
MVRMLFLLWAMEYKALNCMKRLWRRIWVQSLAAPIGGSGYLELDCPLSRREMPVSIALAIC